MTYNCDICSREMEDKSNGHFFDQNRVLTSPSFWQHLYTAKINPLSEEGIGGFLGMFCQDASGYTVCDQCQDMLKNDFNLGREYEIEEFVSSISSGEVDTYAAGTVAGTVWKKLNGRWPSTVELGGGGSTGALYTKEKDTHLGKKMWLWVKRSWKGREAINEELLVAVKSNNIDLVKECIELSADTDNIRCDLGIPAMHNAIIFGDRGMVELLLRSNAKLDVITDEGATPLHIATVCGKLDIAEILVQAGMDIEVTNNKNQTPIQHAVVYKQSEAVAWLIEKGANVNHVGNNDFTPLLSASLAKVADIGIIEKLLSEGANLNSKAIDQSTVLHFSAFHGNLEAVKTFLLAKADINARNIDGGTPLMTSVRQGHSKITSLLLSHGADKSIPGTENGIEETPAQVATRCGFEEISRILE